MKNIYEFVEIFSDMVLCTNDAKYLRMVSSCTDDVNILSKFEASSCIKGMKIYGENNNKQRKKIERDIGLLLGSTSSEQSF